jgi:hypothetical protein
MKKVKFIVERTKDGYSAWHEDLSRGVAATMGDTITELKSNAVESYNLLIEDTGKKQITEDNIQLIFNLGQFFEYYNVINVKALAVRMKMNYTLLSQYITGAKTPSEKQTKKVLQGVKQLGRELYEADFL